MATKAKSIERAPDLRSQVYERLRESIKNGEFPASGKVGEQAIADDYGVSRTPAREALAMLVRDGLLIQEGRGFSLPRYTADDIADVFEVRMCLEPQAMRRLAENATPRQLRTLRTLLENHFTEEGDPETYPETHRAARITLFEMAGNERLGQAIRLYEDHVHYVRQRTLVGGKWQSVSRQRMRSVLEALIAQEGEAAAQAMTLVLQAARDAIIATFQEAQD